MYERFGKPDFVLAEHDTNDVAAGSISIKGGPLLASSTGIYVTMRGVGGHGSRPEAGKDPVVLAAEFVLVAQTIVSRQIDPQQPAVLTVGTIHGGTKNNIIPDEVELGLSRCAPIRRQCATAIIADIRRTANGLAEAYGIPADRMPIVKLGESTPATYNDPALAERLRASAIAALGKEHVEDAKAVMGSEDVGLFTLDGKIPGVMFWLGAADPGKLAESHKNRRAAAGSALRSVRARLRANHQDRRHRDDGHGSRPAEVVIGDRSVILFRRIDQRLIDDRVGAVLQSSVVAGSSCAGSSRRTPRHWSDRPRTMCPPRHPRRTFPCRRRDWPQADRRQPRSYSHSQTPAASPGEPMPNLPVSNSLGT